MPNGKSKFVPRDLIVAFRLYSILVQHACNDRAWLTSECSPRYDNFGTVIHRGLTHNF